ncbi:MAG TPA: ACT domain-containing protein [Methylibium sp.]|uniref:ACT domain-containing protein n=1 Tax=Methylibium sp. TaxID=2067992 RepID=UPI002DB66F13|nr:ACT domain-containing protein [Methylibium sp.]HEU4459991.1 ACT domain-containing protein [Methylibium sp.]
MNGERDLATLQREMAPQLHAPTFVYCCFPDFQVPSGIRPICTFREAEGLTAIVEKSQAQESNTSYCFEARLITLRVHSSLEAVGFMALVAGQLAQARIPCNVVAGYHHDHLFVPTERADDALSLLCALSTADTDRVTPSEAVELTSR